jgi:hypothetical protein
LKKTQASAPTPINFTHPFRSSFSPPNRKILNIYAIIHVIHSFMQNNLKINKIFLKFMQKTVDFTKEKYYNTNHRLTNRCLRYEDNPIKSQGAMLLVGSRGATPLHNRTQLRKR